MDPRLLRYYNRELQYIREMGGEFAREFPKIAGRLGLEEFECADPYVERLLESFAFLTARVQLKVDAEFPRFTQHLLEVVYPHYLAPTPSIAVVQMQPSKSEGALASGFKVPRGSALRSQIGKGEQTACDYRTAHDVTLWPLELTRADYTGYLADLGVSRMPTGKTARAALRLRLKATAGLSLRDLALDRLPLFIRSNDELAIRLYEQLMANAVGVLVRPSGAAAGEGLFTEELPTALGFSDDEALLPYGPRSFQGYRLLQEYFACPARFLFAELGNLKGAVRRCSQPEIEIVVFFDRLDSSLENAVSTAHLALYATPAVNLFPRRADRIHLADWTHEYQVIPDRTRPLDFEVYSVNEVVGHGTSGDQQQPFVPLYATNVRSGGDENAAYFTVHRQPRMLSSKQQSRGPRSSYTGSEVFVALVDGQEGPFRTNMRQLALSIMATNRDLPLHIPIGQGRTDFTLESGAPVESIRCVSGPTPPRASHAHGDTTWRLISHLALNYLSLVGEGANANGALREVLRLYADLSDASTAKQIEGVAGTSSKPVTRRLPIDGPISFGRGMEITLTLDESSFQGSGAYLLGAVLERFFAKYVSINSFTETVLRTVQRGELRRWPPTIGLRHTI